MRILTGDRPTGKLHLGHYFGSLTQRVSLQHQGEQFIVIADLQALTTHWKESSLIQTSIYDIVCDYLAVGIDPEKTTLFIQSCIPELAELTQYFMNLVSLNRVKRNPTVKLEMKSNGFDENLPMGFLSYPISQAADILLFHPTHIPVGDDQLPMIEQTNEIAADFNRCYQTTLFTSVTATLSKTPRLMGIDGKNKMSKSLGNAIFLGESREEIKRKVYQMYTDPYHTAVHLPGNVEGNVVFLFLDLFHPNKEELSSLKEQYRRGGLGDMVLKNMLFEYIDAFIAPIRERRKQFSENSALVWRIIKEGNERAGAIAQATMREVRAAMRIAYF